MDEKEMRKRVKALSKKWYGSSRRLKLTPLAGDWFVYRDGIYPARIEDSEGKAWEAAGTTLDDIVRWLDAAEKYEEPGI